VTDKVVTIATSNNKSVSVEVAYHVPNSVSRVDDPPNQRGFLLLEKAYNTTTETSSSPPLGAANVTKRPQFPILKRSTKVIDAHASCNSGFEMCMQATYTPY